MNNDMFKVAFDAIDDELLADAKNPAIRIAARRKRIIVSSVAACIAAVLVAIPSIKVLSDIDDNKITTNENAETDYEDTQQTIHEPSSSSRPQDQQTSSEPQDEQILNSSKYEPASSDSETLSSSTESASSKKTSTKKKASKKSSAKRPTSKGSSTTTSTSSNQPGIDLDTPTQSDIKITVDDLYFEHSWDNTSTTTYEKIYVPNTKYLYINPIPTDKYVNIYENYYQKAVDKNEAQTLADKYFPKMAAALNVPLLPYEIKEIDSDEIEVDSENPFRIYQFCEKNIISYTANNIVLNGKTVTVNQAQSDEEIINSISDIKQILCDIFEVDFDDVKIYREYNDDGKNGVYRLDVIFYNSDAHPLNDLAGTRPFSDYISITFYNSGDTASDTNLYKIFDISYWSFRTENHSYLKTVSQKELLPLKKAEEYLRKGYVVADGCSLCHAEQTPVDFTDYDYVSLEYNGSYKTGDKTLPYYTFYKNIGTAENGNMIFAHTSVPAIEIEGYEEYFVNKHNNHNNNNQ